MAAVDGNPETGYALQHVLESLDGADSAVTFCGWRASSLMRAPVHLARLVTMTKEQLREREVCRECVAKALFRYAGAAASAAAVLGRLDGRLT